MLARCRRRERCGKREGAESGKETHSEKGQSKKTEDGDVEKETGSKKADDLDEEATHIEPLQAA